MLRHYGAIIDSLASDGTIPLIIRRRSLLAECGPSGCTAPPWIDVSHLFRVTVQAQGRPREVWVQPKSTSEGGEGTFGSTFEYEFTLRSADGVHTDLRSANTLATPDPDVGGYPYRFTLMCMDLNVDGFVDDRDIQAWVDQPVDTTVDEFIAVDDLMVIVDAVYNQP
ncbi:hypothetical protein PHYC_01784 [Phycisphaerales bacterium]|nr:hypothetical protein PHYC_01784 [Phycisphaerales bacterium]